MLCFRCGSHNPDGSEFCSQCGQKFVDTQKDDGKVAPVGDIKLPAGDGDAAAKNDLEIGDRIAERYEVRAVLGAGPTGTVYRAHDLEIEVDVALKVIHGKLLQTRNERKRFLAEIRSARKINHPNVVRIYDEDQDGDSVFFTMQLLEGLSLRKIVRLRNEKKQHFAKGEMEPIFSHICQALDRSHESMAHGNLKPENVIVLPDMLKVTDFGMIGALPRKPFLAAQKTNQGGYAYLAPELRDGENEAAPSADIYSLGVILCEMLTGERYAGPSSSLPKLAAGQEIWQSILVKALNENPSRRHRSARDFFEDLHTASSGPSRKHAQSVPPRPAPSRAAKKKDTTSQGASAGADNTPSRKGVSFGQEDDENYPPTVVNAETMPDEKAPTALEPLEEAVETVSDDDLIEDIAAAPEPLEEADEFMNEEFDEEFVGVVEDELDEGETLVAQTTPHPSLAPDSELRVARPVNATGFRAEPEAREVPAEKMEEDDSGKVRILKRPGPSIPPARPVVPRPQAQSYGPFSQPPFPPSFVSQPPMPQPTRAPTYVFLSVLLVIVGVGVYFLVDYLRAQTELARAQARIATEGKALPARAGLPTGPLVADVRVTKPDAGPSIDKRSGSQPDKAIPAPTKAETEKKAAAAEQARREEEAKIAAEAARKKELPIKTTASARKPKAAAKKIDRQKAAAERRAELAKKEAEKKRRVKEEIKREEARKLAEARAEARKKAAAGKPKVEEVPEVGGGRPRPPDAAIPPPSKEKVIAAVEPAPAAAEKCRPGMVFIPDGTSYVGSATNDPMRNFGESKLHTVQNKAYCIDRYEFPNGPGRKPTAGVSWKQAQKLCRKRGKRLCTEVEWEYACKGKSNRRFPYGNKWNPDGCNTESASGEDRSIGNCGGYPRCKSPFGVFDMSGNVSEWTASPYSPGAGARTYKGGSATRPNWATRCASRSSASPGTRRDDLGFRCCDNPK
ncbi:MAG TPA: SUMF1/EgtB/PvdO family nonheme iron enzyme [Myxococcota bacterium]|nr:SUMF1/EgtB/PvdO family nonheme iron enzyme [Myxococcota bacterium]